ncbi:RNA-binding S4 domain-containing protein [Pseudoalteromonas sp. MMG024]|uniref:RNA-binding S4 domain-containing protein n=1 Tax=Pseudoalteromonas sp. MMG024 TaxID=2909980 RepID=UPI001F35222F|nr:RNA-binding S4 domain-containing protein [Pseudoalteromonas sp. MMG024]MCF6458423.1 RNA-binding S4 domain-containing protein [Pseudoalteromonas sp. MMG024]
MSQAFVVELEEQPIELCNLLKLLDLVESGGQAKMLIADGYVALNGEICLQKRKKVYAGDTVEFDGQLFQIAEFSGESPESHYQENESFEDDVQDDDAAEYQPVTEAPKATTPANNQPPSKAKKADKKPAAKSAKAKDKDKKTGRKPISFG